jgi:hypothetical protein
MDKFVGGAKVWLSPSTIGAEFTALTAAAKLDMVGALTSPRALGFLLVPAAAILALFLWSGAAKRRRTKNPRRLRRANLRRRVARGRRQNPRKALYWVAYGMTPASGTQAARTSFNAAVKTAERIGEKGGVATVWQVDPDGTRTRVYHASPARTAVRKLRASRNPKRRAARRRRNPGTNAGRKRTARRRAGGGRA